MNKTSFLWSLECSGLYFLLVSGPRDGDIDFTGVNLSELLDLARSSGSLIVGPTFEGERAWKTYVTDLMAHKVRGQRSIEVLEAVSSVLKYGPEAVRKIKELLWFKPDSSGTWPPGKIVKIALQEVEKEPAKESTIFLWRPETEYFHEVIMKQTAIGDFKVFYQDKDGKAQHFREDIVGNKIVTQFFAYHIVRRGDLIDVVYGKHKESMEVSGGPSLPSQNCIQYNGNLFAVWPPASPHSKTSSGDMKGLTEELPPGWQIVDSSQEGFDGIRQWVIAPYGWHTSCLLTRGPNGQLQGWKTPGWSCDNAGEQWKPDKMENYIEKKDESRFHFRLSSLRLLIQAHPSANHELVNNWKRYVQLSAQHEWAQRLGMPQGPQVESLSRL
eukprot:s656_g8.t1